MKGDVTITIFGYSTYVTLVTCVQASTDSKITALQWTLSAMTSENKNGGDSWGTLYGRPMERLAFRYDRHEEIARYFGCGMYTIIQW